MSSRLVRLHPPHLLFTVMLVILVTFATTIVSIVERFGFNLDALCVSKEYVFQGGEANCAFPLKSYQSEDALQKPALRLATYLGLNPNYDRVIRGLLELPTEPLEPDVMTGTRLLLIRYLHTHEPIEVAEWQPSASSNILEGMAAFFQTNGITETAQSAMELAYKLDSGWYDQWQRGINARQQARQYRELGQWDESSAAHERAIESFAQTDHPLADEYTCYGYFRLGEIAEAQGDDNRAIEYYTQGIWASPQHSDFSRPVNLLLAANGSIDEVDAYLSHVRRGGPQDNPYLWSYSASILEHLGAREMALQVLRETPDVLVDTQIIQDIRTQLDEE